MTDAQWVQCSEPARMLAFLRGKASARKLRLFACACSRYRFVWHQLDELSQNAVEVAERFADGQATQSELEAARQKARDAIGATWVTFEAPGKITGRAAREVARAATFVHARNAAKHAIAGYHAAEASFLRDLFSGPLRQMEIASNVLSWNSGIVVRLASAIYHDRTFDHLPILADALEDAGCENADILSHCRGPGPHVRGCWVIDLLLGKP